MRTSGLLVVSAMLVVTHAREARACGGCFHPEDQPLEQNSVVTAHRMALSISNHESVLWDQVQYDGAPEEFVWVLPIKPGARLEVAADAWFEALDAATTTRVSPPTLQCFSGTTSPEMEEYGYVDDREDYTGCQVSGPIGLAGCASDEAGARRVRLDGGDEGDPEKKVETLAPHAGPVSVVHEGSVGPYETVTIHSDVPNALPKWLKNHGFAIDLDSAPIIEAYAAEGFDFIAVRLRPDQGVQQMKPLRVVMPGAVTTLPLRMVTAGVGVNVALTLLVIGEGRWAISNFPSAVLPRAVEWDFSVQGSDYSALRSLALEEAGWLTNYAQRGALLSPIPNPVDSSPVQFQTALGGATNIADVYLTQGFFNGETSLDCIGQLAALSESGELVVNPCSGGEPCEPLSDGTLDARELSCGELTDLSVALTGMHPRDVWLTRLEAFLPREALAQDLILAPAEQVPADGWLIADTYKNPPCTVVSANERRAPARRIPASVLVVVVFASLAMLRRRLS